MTTVAQRHGLSDVGLRKICVKLDVPVPPRGYWARLTAGQKLLKKSLPESDANPTFTRAIRVEEKNEELERRMAKARDVAVPEPATSTLIYNSPGHLSRMGREALQIDKALAKLKEEDGVISLLRDAWADVSVLTHTRARVVALLDRTAYAVKAAGGTFDLRLNQESKFVL